jgi:hypothetical protein
MGLDIRIPLGLIFLITGAILIVYGAMTYGSAIYGVSMGVNLNLIWGVVMALFGVGMLLAGRMGKK